MSSHEAETISYPSIAIVLAIGYLLYRYFSGGSSPSSSSSSASATSRNGLHFTPAQVDQVAAMFPQLSRRDIMWDLQRNRGSVPGTIERVLGGRGLDPAPPSFQPNIPSTATPVNSTSAGRSTGSEKNADPDLITRYNLHARIAAEEKGKQREDAAADAAGWSSSKEARQEALKRRRDEMILQARRKMMDQDKERTGQWPG